ncbi:hypothetical protein RZ863_017705, partial [Clostridioides difficile]|nr:hypothetical protein [Clostridioides difficile]
CCFYIRQAFIKSATKSTLSVSSIESTLQERGHESTHALPLTFEPFYSIEVWLYNWNFLV